MRHCLLLGSVLLLTLQVPPLKAQPLIMEVGLENRFFFESGAWGNSDQSETSIRLRAEFSRAWNQDRHVLSIVPYLLLSAPDAEKGHFDIREALWMSSFGDWEVRVGVGRDFWGVAEAAHLVDIINQTDLVENVDGEQKLGQPMASLRYRSSSLGNLRMIVLPWFRERTFPGGDGRVRSRFVVDPTLTEYEAADQERNVDLALRWNHSWSFLDVGVSYFTGTSRDPLIRPVPGGAAADPGEAVAAARYVLIRQGGLDAQVTWGPLLLKHESVFRAYTGDEAAGFYAQVSGLEYTFFGIAETDVDVGVLGEYLYANEEENALTPFTNDLFIAARLGLNDSQSTELLAGAVLDLSDPDHFLTLETRRRLSSVMSATLQLRYFVSPNGTAPLARESHLGLEVSYQF